MKQLYLKAKMFWWGTLSWLHPDLHSVVFRFRIYVKYIIAGGTAAAVNLCALAFFVELVRVHYLPASALAFMVGFAASFFLQKFFTFGDTKMHLVHRQLILYFLIAMVNLGLNTVLVYVFVDFLSIWYVLSQAIASIFIAVSSFLLYRRFVFNGRT